MRNKLLIALCGAISILTVTSFVHGEATTITIDRKYTIKWPTKTATELQSTSETSLREEEYAKRSAAKKMIESIIRMKSFIERERKNSKRQDYARKLTKIADKMGELDIPATIHTRDQQIGVLRDLVRSLKAKRTRSRR